MTWALVAAGCCTLISQSSPAHLSLVAFFVYLFAAFFSLGGAAVPSAYSAECFPLPHREIGVSWAVATRYFWAAVLSITFPALLERFKPVGAFGFFACLSVLAWGLVFLFVRETKQKTLEELDHVFAVPVWKHARYQVTEVVPYLFRRYVLWRRDAKIGSLYTFDDDESELSEIHPVPREAAV